MERRAERPRAGDVAPARQGLSQGIAQPNEPRSPTAISRNSKGKKGKSTFERSSARKRRSAHATRLPRSRTCRNKAGFPHVAIITWPADAGGFVLRPPNAAAPSTSFHPDITTGRTRRFLQIGAAEKQRRAVQDMTVGHERP